MGKNNKQRRAQKKLRRKKRRKERNKQRERQKRRPIGPEMQLLQNPIANISEDDRKELIKKISENSENVFQESLSKIREILYQYDPIILLSVLANYGLIVPVKTNGITTRDSEHKLLQSHVEILQGLALQIKPDELKRMPFGPDVVQDLWDSLTNLMHAIGFRNYDEFIDIGAEPKAIKFLQHCIRANTQMVRNWGYYSQVKAISLEIYEFFNSDFEDCYGMSASKIVDLFELMAKETEDNITQRFHTLSKLYNLKNKRELIFKYYELINSPSESAEDFFQNTDIKKLPYKAIFSMIMSHYDLRLPEIFKFSTKDLSSKLNIDEFAVRNIMDLFSYELGALKDYNTEYLFLSNPVWLKPVINFDNGDYFCVIPQVFFSFVFQSLDRLVENMDLKNLSDRRSQYLEDKILEIINRRFPESNAVAGIKWKDNDIEYETDLITFIDSHAIIVEAKSGKISDPALRGAPDRLKKHIEEILVAPNIQSKRLKTKLEVLISDPTVEDDLRDKLPVDLSSIHKIIRVSVSLEDFATIQTNIEQLRETGWLPDDFETCPTLNLADFETLFDILDHPVHIIHYLERRQEFETNIQYFGDELDLIGFYIDTLFNKIDPDINFVLTEMSYPLDTYYNSKDAGIDTPKPKPKISSLFKGILQQLEQRRTPRWTEIGAILNWFSPDDQRQLEQMAKKLKSNVHKKWMVKEHKNTAIITPSIGSIFSLSYIAYNDNNVQERTDFIDNAAKLGLEAEHIKQCIVIAKNIDHDEHYYDFIGLFQ